MVEESQAKKENKLPEELEIAIKFTVKTGNIQVKGVIHNEMLALYMLEKAKDLVKAINRPQPPLIQKPKGGLLNFVRGRK